LNRKSSPLKVATGDSLCNKKGGTDMDSKKLSHTVWECKYHIVWIPKRRRKIIYGKLRKEIGHIIRKLCEYKGIEIVEGNAGIDHIHLCISIPPKHSVSSIVGYLKGKSTMIVFERYGKRKRNFRGHSCWARGYYVTTVGRDEEKVRQYIRNQETNEMVEEKYEAPEADNLF
jgi:putative transposase